jgi:hypothetical protein
MSDALDRECDDAGVLAICQYLVMCASGALEPPADDSLSGRHAWLRRRFERWRPSTLSEARAYDDAVRALVGEALAFVEARRWW